MSLTISFYKDVKNKWSDLFPTYSVLPFVAGKYDTFYGILAPLQTILSSYGIQSKNNCERIPISAINV